MRGFPSVAFTHSPSTRQVGALKVRPKVVLCTNARLCKYCGVSAHMLMDSQGVPRCIFHPQSTPEAQTHTPTRALELCNKLRGTRRKDRRSFHPLAQSCVAGPVPAKLWLTWIGQLVLQKQSYRRSKCMVKWLHEQTVLSPVFLTGLPKWWWACSK